MLRITKLIPRKSTNLRYFCRTSDEIKSTTTGIIVIGDEILKGEVADTNSAFLAVELHKLGLTLKKISVIGDDILEVCEEVRRFSSTFDYVITSGGIGPTHDDITFEAVAQAFHVPLVENADLKQLCVQFYKTTSPDYPGMKLAQIPATAILNYAPKKEGQKRNYPIVSINNVYIFPGIPDLLQKAFCASGAQLFISQKRFFTKNIYCNITEDKIAGVLNGLVKEYPQVQFGSYPKMYDSTYKVKITIESNNEKMTNEAYIKLLNLLPKECIVNVV